MSTLIREMDDLSLDEPSDERNELAQLAMDRLGYSALFKECQRETDTVKQNEQLRNAFKDLDIVPFSYKSVEAYKAEVIQETVGKDDSAELNEKWCNRALRFLLAVPIFGVATLIFGCSNIGDPYFTFSLILTIISILGAIVCGVTSANYGESIPKLDWVKIPIHSYTNQIPEFAIQTAVDIKSRCPNIVFEIEELRAIKKPIHADPFLVAIDASGNRYYLEVWNEPKFRRHLQRD